MDILGIDPSSTSTGYGFIAVGRRDCAYVDCGCLRPRPGGAFEDRLVFLYDGLQELLARRRPHQVAIESSFYGKDADASAKLGEARGVIRLAVRQAGLEAAFYTPAEIKKAVVGSGQATKEQVQFMVARLLRLKDLPRPLDASDALAIALCHAHQATARQLAPASRRRPEVEALLARMSNR
ncbi:MAG: crossover junction endodeoxyribonuclease RuvC [Gemmatimonadota bacterium]